MNAKRLFTTLPVITAFAIAAAPAGAATSTESQAAVSENWAGYAIGGSETSTSSSGDFSSVSGSWVQPTATCTAGSSTSGSGTTYSAFWVGLGGASEQSDGLEQAGTQADCSSSGQASYYAWYELVPAAPVKLDMTVKPGDQMSGKVTVNGDAVTITVTDATSGQSITKNLTTSSIDTSSAEWIAEAPSECDSQNDCQSLSLANFGSVTFTNASATADGHTGTISDSDWASQAVELSPAASQSGIPGAMFGGAVESQTGSSSSTAGATPSALSSDGSSFSVKYAADATSLASSSGSTGAGYGQTGGNGATGGYGYGYGATGGDGAGSGYGYGYGGGSTGYGYGGGSTGYDYGDPYGGYGPGAAEAGGYGITAEEYGSGDGYDAYGPSIALIYGY